mgnify:CR=1 FL=1
MSYTIKNNTRKINLHKQNNEEECFDKGHIFIYDTLKNGVPKIKALTKKLEIFNYKEQN